LEVSRSCSPLSLWQWVNQEMKEKNGKYDSK
jgi:hypothetical protein